MKHTVNSHATVNSDTLKSRRRLNLFHPYMALFPPVFLSVPMALPNNISQPLAIILLAPLVIACLARSFRSPGFIILIFGSILISLVHIVIDPGKQHSPYQGIRSFLPFFYAVVIIISSKDIIANLYRIIEGHPRKWKSAFNTAIFLFCTLSSLQTLSFFAGASLANPLSFVSGGRVMIFQTTSCVLILFYGILRNNYFIIGSMLLVVLGTGSKAVFISSVLVTIFGIVPKFSVAKTLKLFGGAILFGAIIMSTKPLVIERLAEFIAGTSSQNEEAFSDVTREYEISQARQTFLSSPTNFIFGAGFSMQVSKGVATRDPSWRENSKYDIENGYWGVLSKLGVLFSIVLLIIIYIYLPKNSFYASVLIVELVMFFKTSYQLFAYFDGCMILIWAIIVSVAYKLNSRNVGPGKSRKRRHRPSAEYLPPLDEQQVARG